MSGPIRTVDWSRSESDGGSGKLTIGGVDDTTLLARYTCWPTPTAVIGSQTASVYKLSASQRKPACAPSSTSTPAPAPSPPARTRSSPSPRTAPRGRTVTREVNQFDNLLTVLADIAGAAGLGFRVVQVGTSLQFQVYQPPTVADRPLQLRPGQPHRRLLLHHPAHLHPRHRRRRRRLPPPCVQDLRPHRPPLPRPGHRAVRRPDVRGHRLRRPDRADGPGRRRSPHQRRRTGLPGDLPDRHPAAALRPRLQRGRHRGRRRPRGILVHGRRPRSLPHLHRGGRHKVTATVGGDSTGTARWPASTPTSPRSRRTWPG
jgi:hypothetical protein